MRGFDVVVIGGGIVGLATARALLEAEPDRRICVVEKEASVATHQTGHNSGVIHSGLYYRPGSYKARLCTEGRDALYRFCEEHEVAHEQCGKVVVATRETQINALDELERRGRTNGLDTIERLDASQVRSHEPHVRAVAGLHVPHTGIVDYRGMSEALREDIERRGGMVLRRFRVGRIEERDGLITVTASTRATPNAAAVRARQLVNCAGLESDRIAKLAGVEPGVTIIPFRGEYFRLLPSATGLVRHLIYPVPDSTLPFLGVHFTRMIGGGIEAGPNAVLAFDREGYSKTSFSLRDTATSLSSAGFWRLAQRFWRTGLSEFARSASHARFVNSLRELIPEIGLRDVEPYGAGVRAQAVDAKGRLVDDFHIVETDTQVHVLNAPSPAATASLAIGKEIATRVDGRS